MKKSFTLVEILIAISIFSIISVFLYKSLDSFKKSEKFLKKEVNKEYKLIKFKKIIFNDFVNATNIKIDSDKDKDILTFQSKNFYYNPFYLYKVYFITKKGNLYRCESNKKFNKHEINYDFFKNTICNRLLNNIERFKILNFKKKNDKLLFIKFKDSKKVYFRLYHQ